MAWMEKLYETYERCAGSELPDAQDLLPIAHTTQQAHIEIVLDARGRFRRASVVPRGQQQTLIPCTEDSSGRSGTKPKPHPLCDNLQYVAKDFRSYGGIVTAGFAKSEGAPHDEYLELLHEWSRFAPDQPKLAAICAYVSQGSVVGDLLSAGILLLADPSAKTPLLLKSWTGSGEPPDIFRSVPNGSAPEDAFVRWRVEAGSELATGTWEDAALIESWQGFYSSRQSQSGLCPPALARRDPLPLV